MIKWHSGCFLLFQEGWNCEEHIFPGGCVYVSVVSDHLVYPALQPGVPSLWPTLEDSLRVLLTFLSP